MNDSYWLHRYVPKTDPAEWASRAARIGELYAELKPIMREIEKRHPEIKRHFPSEIDASDGFFRLEDLVVNVQNIIGAFDGKKNVLALERLTNCFAPKTEPIFTEAKAMLQTYIEGEENFAARRNARRIADELEGTLREAYQAAETMRGSSRMKD